MDRTTEFVERLGLRPHPEGGFYAEVYRSEETVVAGESRVRPALTAIYFLLRRGEVSRWHRVLSDEVWSFVEGAPLDLHVVDPSGARRRTLALGPFSAGCEPHVIVPAGSWQAAVPRGAYALVNCFVAPGFDFEDFAMAEEQDRAMLGRVAPDLARQV